MTTKAEAETIRKIKFVGALAQRLDIPLYKAEVVYDGVFDVLKDCLHNGDTVVIAGLGKLRVLDAPDKPNAVIFGERKPMVNRLPRVAFTPTRLLREAIAAKRGR